MIIFLCLVSICHFYFGSQSTKRMSKNWSISHSNSPKKAKRLYFFRKFPDDKMVLVLLCIVYRANRLQKMSLKVDFINWNLKHYWASSILNLHSIFIILQFLLLPIYYFKFVSKLRNSQIKIKHLWNWIKLHHEIELIVVIQWIGLKSLRAESRDQKRTQTVKLLTLVWLWYVLHIMIMA